MTLDLNTLIEVDMTSDSWRGFQTLTVCGTNKLWKTLIQKVDEEDIVY